MFHRVARALALLSALTGCVASPPKGPLVEYREGQAPITRRVKCEANYVLLTKDAAAARGQIAEHHIMKGERVGFRREPDGTVTAIAPGYKLALPPGAYAWEVVRASVPPWRERFWCEVRDRGIEAERVTGAVLLFTAVVVAVVGGVVLYFWLKDKTSSDS
ncbi:hypothetical protein [Frigoriglobus tundricola]|uniref:Uncharacterized protein n=1 Tax=Frigoriglobus tundricola TaxID=2774151 RepID=A0A6M5YJP7_9BACT|nr:hypothetical protein [Frigoriglobus tundricola]QJW93496.1 hypothetical protein FTUN_1002 [Frigoriglobus tundricola]